MEGQWCVKVWMGQRSLFRDNQVPFYVNSDRGSKARQINFQMNGMALTGGLINKPTQFTLVSTNENRERTPIDLGKLKVTLISKDCSLNLDPVPEGVGEFTVAWTVPVAGLYSIVCNYKGFDVCMQNGIIFQSVENSRQSEEPQDGYEQADIEDDSYY